MSVSEESRQSTRRAVPLVSISCSCPTIVLRGSRVHPGSRFAVEKEVVIDRVREERVCIHPQLVAAQFQASKRSTQALKTADRRYSVLDKVDGLESRKMLQRVWDRFQEVERQIQYTMWQTVTVNCGQEIYTRLTHERFDKEFRESPTALSLLSYRSSSSRSVS